MVTETMSSQFSFTINLVAKHDPSIGRDYDSSKYPYIDNYFFQQSFTDDPNAKSFFPEQRFPDENTIIERSCTDPDIKQWLFFRHHVKGLVLDSIKDNTDCDGFDLRFSIDDISIK